MKPKKLLLPLAIISLGVSFIAYAESAKKEQQPPKTDADMQKVLDALASLHADGNQYPMPDLLDSGDLAS